MVFIFAPLKASGVAVAESVMGQQDDRCLIAGRWTPCPARDRLPHWSLSPARDAVQFQKWVLSRHKAIRIVPARVFFFFSGFIETQIPDGVHSARYLVEISPVPSLSDFVFLVRQRVLRVLCLAKPRQNVFNKLPFLRGEIPGGRQLCDGQRQAGETLRDRVWVFCLKKSFFTDVVFYACRSPKWAHT